MRRTNRRSPRRVNARSPRKVNTRSPRKVNTRSPRKLTMPKPNYKRPSPPYPAKYYPGKTMKGNRGAMYISKMMSNGIYRWFIVKEITNKERMMVKKTPLSKKQQSWCRCVLHLAAKQGSECLKERKWGKKVKGKTCYNPYAVCSKTVGTSVSACDLWYDLDKLTKQELLGMANLKRIGVTSRDSKLKIKKAIETHVKSKY